MNFKIKTNDSNICIKTIRETKDLLEEIKGLGPKVALVDKSISENYPFILNEFKNLNIDVFVITDPETEKNLETLEKGYYFLQKNNFVLWCIFMGETSENPQFNSTFHVSLKHKVLK